MTQCTVFVICVLAVIMSSVLYFLCTSVGKCQAVMQSCSRGATTVTNIMIEF